MQHCSHIELLPLPFDDFDSAHCSPHRTTTSYVPVDLGEADPRAGRWSTEEIAFVEELSRLFSQGVLPVKNGTKLSEFLSELLMCRVARLSKKRKYTGKANIAYIRAASSNNDLLILARKETEFLKSIMDTSLRAKINFNLRKSIHWRYNFIKSCCVCKFTSITTHCYTRHLFHMTF